MTVMKGRVHQISKLLVTSALTTTLMGLGAYAQSNGDAMETVTVTGVRASIERAVNMKRDATTVQDSISALELGKFPDANVADSLSHITGVSISRTAGGEGQKVSVRGLGPEYTLSTFNGRILATDGAGRDFAYDVLPSDVISGADVIKGAEASNMEGAIGGLINLRSASPFDKTGQHAAVRLEGDRNLMSELNGYKLSGVYSNTFFNDTVGVLFGVVYEKRKDRTDEAGNDGGWTRNPDPTGNTATEWTGNAWGGAIDPNGNGQLDPDEYGLIGPGQFRVGSIIEKKTRTAYSAKVEWRPSDRLTVVVDGLKTNLDSPQVGYQQSFYPLFAPDRWSNMVIKNGIVTSFDMANPDPDQRLNPELLNQTTYRVVNTDLYGINAKWKATDSLTITGDLYRSKSARNSGGQDSYVVLRMNQPNSAHIELTSAGVPNVSVKFDDGRELASGLASGAFKASDFNTHYFSLAGDNIIDRVTGASLAGDWVIGKYWIDNVQFGVNRTERKKTRDLVNNALTGGADYYSGDYAINVGDLGGNVLSHSFSLPNFMDGVNADFPRTFLSFDIAGYEKALAAYDGHERPKNEGPYSYAAAAPAWNPLQSYRVSEGTWSGFVQANLSSDSWSGNIGVRIVHTKTSSQAWEAKIKSIVPNGQFNNTVTYEDPTEVTQDNDYTYFLPAVNVTYNILDDLHLRMGAARTVARPSVEMLAPTSTTESVSWGEFTETFGGNAKLKPYSADQFDSSLEWYFDSNSIMNFAFFYKHITDQITSSWETGQDIGVQGHLFNISRPINGDYAEVKGIEVGLQHFMENGLGVRAQYTHNWAESWVGGEQRALEGIAPSVYSLGLFYDHGPISVSFSGDYTEGYVTANNVLGPGYNEQSDPILWVTAQASYKLTENLELTVEGQNLMDDTQTTTINGNPLLTNSYYRYGRSIRIGAAYRF